MYAEYCFFGEYVYMSGLDFVSKRSFPLVSCNTDLSDPLPPGSRRLAEAASKAFRGTGESRKLDLGDRVKAVKVIDGQIIGGEGRTPSQILAALRTGHGLSQERLVDRVEISKSTIARSESGRRPITAKSSEKLSAFFGITNSRSFAPSKEIQVFVDRGQVIGGEGLAPHELLFALRDGYSGGLSQKKLGYESRIAGTYISQYEADSRPISRRGSAKLANFFGIENLQIFCTVKGPHVFVEDGQIRGAEGLTCGQIVRALRIGRNLTTDQLSERIGGVPKGKSIQVLETTNQIGRKTAKRFAKEFGLADHTLLLPKKPEAARSTSTTESKKRKRSDDDLPSDLVIRAGSLIRPPLSPWNNPF
jgi:transcriptional regulator with XRE-family HTH domain